MMFVISSAGMAFADDIYKWTDDDGNVHYGDRPASEPSEEPLAVSSEISGPSKDEADNEAIAAASEPPEATPEKLRTQVLDGEKKSAGYKARLHKYLTSRRLYRNGEDSERVYLDEQEIFSARERVQKQIEKYCDF